MLPSGSALVSFRPRLHDAGGYRDNGQLPGPGLTDEQPGQARATFEDQPMAKRKRSNFRTKTGKSTKAKLAASTPKGLKRGGTRR